ncbi:hypothetical protein [Sulfurospirillum arcachonense]|uniref:hypothetical protein n=1 Tax=Sulfurospirillum arcachonense TaxID=57666 RepID=UPI0004690546|nr:hypothetical protein [Sulfurospirillum arcachonense]
MKIALACQSVLLEKSLEIFLKNYLSPYKQCDFVISDSHIEIDKPLFFISSDDSDLNIPFSKSSLIMAIEKFYSTMNEQNIEKNVNMVKKIDINELEEKITKLTNNFRDDLVNIIKDYYEE